MQIKRGVVFKSAGYFFIIPLDQVHSVIQGLVISPLPWTEDWLLGVAHVNGVPLSVTDFRAFCSGQLTSKTTPGESTIIFSEGEWMYGLLVTTLIGMREYDVSSLDANEEASVDKGLYEIQACISGQIHLEGNTCYLLDLYKLLQLEKFMNPVKIQT